MEAVNVTIRMNKETKQQFDAFCENVGINITTAFTMFVKATLRTRELPFPITDVEDQKQTQNALIEAFKAAQEASVANGTDGMTMAKINEEIAAYRQEKG